MITNVTSIDSIRCLSRSVSVALCTDVASRSLLGEAPLWFDGALFRVDANGYAIRRLASDGSVVSWTFDQPVIAVAATDESDWLRVVRGDDLILWSPTDDRRIAAPITLSGWSSRRFKDAAIVPAGQLWVGIMRNNIAPDGKHIDETDGDGALLCIGRSGARAVMVTDLSCPKGLGFAPDGSRVYWADSPANRIMVGHIHPAGGRITNHTTFDVGFARGIPDGSAVDAQGFVWNAGSVAVVLSVSLRTAVLIAWSISRSSTLPPAVLGAKAHAVRHQRQPAGTRTRSPCRRIAGVRCWRGWCPLHRFRRGSAFMKDSR